MTSTAAPFRLLKMQATGNDFLIADCTLTPAPQAGIRPRMAKRYCDRLYGFGADGFLILEKNNRGVYWDFYNSDGSAAAMCGNAARAVGRYIADQAKSTSSAFHATIGDVTAKIISTSLVEVSYELPNLVLRSLPWHAAAFVDTGVPHAVIKCDGLEEQAKLVSIARDIKSKFSADGINVTFYTAMFKAAAEAITHERGVDNFTLSCGTGALAAAYVNLGGQDGDCEVKVPGGILNVTFREKTAILRGEAHYIGWCTPIDGDHL